MIQRTTSATNSGGVDEGGDLGTQDLREPLAPMSPGQARILDARQAS